MKLITNFAIAFTFIIGVSNIASAHFETQNHLYYQHNAIQDDATQIKTPGVYFDERSPTRRTPGVY